MGLQKYILENISDNKKKQLFNDIANQQRGEPERIMLKIQHTIGGGVLFVIVEHVGDLTHRMTQDTLFNTAGYDYVGEKVDKCVRILEHPYGFEKEMKENFKANAEYKDMTYNQLYNEAKSLLNRYAKAHEKLPVYNDMQKLARDSAVHVGNMEWNRCLLNLKELQRHLNKGVDHWVEMAHKIEYNHA